MKKIHNIPLYRKSKPNNTSPVVWRRLEPYLDEIVASLGEQDRAVLAMLYFENKSVAVTGRALKLNEKAVKRCVSRALKKVQKIYHKKSISLSTEAIAAAVSLNSVKPAPSGLAIKIIAEVTRQQAMFQPQLTKRKLKANPAPNTKTHG